MSVLFAILFVLSLLIMTGGMVAGLLFFASGLSSWQSLPRDVYSPFQQRIFGMRPAVIFALLACLSLSGELAKRFDIPKVAYGLNAIALAGIFLMAVGTLRWASKLRKNRAALDPRLNRFVHYAFWGSLTVMALQALSLLAYLLKL